MKVSTTHYYLRGWSLWPWCWTSQIQMWKWVTKSSLLSAFISKCAIKTVHDYIYHRIDITVAQWTNGQVPHVFHSFFHPGLRDPHRGTVGILGGPSRSMTCAPKKILLATIWPCHFFLSAWKCLPMAPIISHSIQAQLLHEAQSPLLVPRGAHRVCVLWEFLQNNCHMVCWAGVVATPLPTTGHTFSMAFLPVSQMP